MTEMFKILLVALAVLCLSHKLQALNNEADIQPEEIDDPFERYVMYATGKRREGDDLVYSYHIDDTVNGIITLDKTITYVEALFDGNGEHELIITDGGIGQDHIKVKTENTTESQLIYLYVYGV